MIHSDTTVRSILGVLKPAWTQLNDRMLGIRTIAIAGASGSATTPQWWRGERFLAAQFYDNYGYATADYWNIRRVLSRLDLGREDVFYDIGCGMGRVLCCAASRGIKRCVGIEISEALCREARENIFRMRRKHCPIDVICGDASTADYDDGTIYWMFNPFGEDTLRSTVERIHSSVTAKPRKVRIVYYNAHHAHVLGSARWLEIETSMRTPGGQPVTIWSNCS